MNLSVKKKTIIAVVSTSILIFILIFILVFSATRYFIFSFIYSNNYKLTDVGTEISPDGKYSVLFQMVGQPEWPFGATTVKVTVKEVDSNKQLEVIDASINDDGATLRNSNWTVVWQSDTVEITLKGSEQEDKSYIVPLQ